MSEYMWLDTNVILRYLLNDDAEHSASARTVIDRAERGELTLRIPTFIVCEAVFILEGKDYTRHEIHAALSRFLAIPGINAESVPAVQLALLWYREKNVDFGDALLYAHCSLEGGLALTFNKRHYRKLGTQWREP